MTLSLPLETSRLRLRDFTADDFAGVHAWSSDPEVVRFLFWGPRDVAETTDYLARMIASQRETPRLVWEIGIEERASGRLVGACDLTLAPDGAGPDVGDLGFVLAREAWGRGIASELSHALVQAGFASLGLTRIIATCDPENAASARVLERAGLHRTRLVERHRFAKQRWWTSWEWALERAEWEALRGGAR